MLFSHDDKMAEVIHHNYMILPILNRFGIQLGFGNKTIIEVCEHHSINTDFFLEIINCFNNKEYYPEEHLQSFSVKLIVDYLSKTHRYYVNVKLPKIKKLLEELFETSTTEEKQYAGLVMNFFKEYEQELKDHTKREDESIYPYGLEVEDAFIRQRPSHNILDKIEKASIKEFEREHGNVEEKLLDLKNIIIKFMPPSHNGNLCNSILTEVFNLEEDLNNHSNIEEKVFVPKIIAMENILMKSNESPR